MSLRHFLSAIYKQVGSLLPGLRYNLETEVYWEHWSFVPKALTGMNMFGSQQILKASRLHGILSQFLVD